MGSKKARVIAARFLKAFFNNYAISVRKVIKSKKPKKWRERKNPEMDL